MAARKAMTQEDKDKIIKWIKDGLLSRQECADRLKIDIVQLHREMKKDPVFAKRIEETEFLSHDELVTAMYKHAHTKDYRAAWTLLTRKWQKRWGQPATYTSEEMLKMALQFSELIKEFVPEEKQVGFATKVESIVNTMEEAKKRPQGWHGES